MVEILAKDNIDGILEDVRHYVGETEDLPLVRIDDVTVHIGIDENSDIFFLLEDSVTVISIKYVDDHFRGMSLKDAFDSIVCSLAKHQ